MTLSRKPLVLIAAFLAACSGGSQTTTTGSGAGTASIDGNIAGSSSSALRVEVSGTTSATSTDSSGHFALVGVPAGASALRITGGSVDATLSIQALLDTEHRSVTIALSGNTATEEHERTGSEFRGKVEAVASPNLTVAGRTIVTSSATTITKNGAAAGFADLKVGDSVEIHGALQADGSVVASAIEDGDGDGHPQDDIIFTATLSKIDGSTLTVGDIPVVVSSTTVITKGDKTIAIGDLAVGDHLLVKGQLQPGPSVNADQIRDLVPDVDPDVRIAGKITAIDTTAKTITIAGFSVDGDDGTPGGSTAPAPTTSTTVSYDANTKFGGFGSPGGAGDLKAGDFVVVAGSQASAGAILALTVYRLPPPPVPNPNVVELHGTFKSAAADGSSFVITVPASTAGGTPTDTTVGVNAQTVYGGSGDPKGLSDFKAGDQVVTKATKAADGSLTANALYRMPPPPPPPPPPSLDVHGTISAVGTDGISLTTDGGSHRFVVNASTQITIGGATATMGDLKVGQSAEVKAVANATATLPPVATSIAVSQ